MPEASLKGRLLVANPALPDRNFHRTVVLVLEHNDDGAVGVVLNRPSDTSIEGALPRWEGLAAEPGVIFVGGPVSPEAAICLAQVDAMEDDDRWRRLSGQLGTLDLSDDETDLMTQIRGLRVFVGYAGWGAGQLEGELALGAWFVVDAEPDDALSEEPRMLWRNVLRRQPGPVAALSSYPEDVSVN
jgi:putative transcriptional regulator